MSGRDSKLSPLCNHIMQPLMVSLLVSLMGAFMVSLCGKYTACRMAPDMITRISRTKYGWQKIAIPRAS